MNTIITTKRDLFLKRIEIYFKQTLLSLEFQLQSYEQLIYKIESTIQAYEILFKNMKIQQDYLPRIPIIIYQNKAHLNKLIKSLEEANKMYYHIQSDINELQGARTTFLYLLKRDEELETIKKKCVVMNYCSKEPDYKRIEFPQNNLLDLELNRAMENNEMNEFIEQSEQLLQTSNQMNINLNNLIKCQ